MDEKKNLDELLSNKKQNEEVATEQSETTTEDSNSTEALKKRMQKVINASKKLDNDLEEDPKKVALRQKLAKAKREAEEEAEDEEMLASSEEKEASNDEMSMEDEIALKKAKYYAEKNAKAKAKLDEMQTRLNEVEKQNLTNDTPFKTKENKVEPVKEEPTFTVPVFEENKVEETNDTVVEEVVEQPVQETVETVQTNDEDLAKHIVNNIVNQEKENTEEVETNDNEDVNEDAEAKQELLLEEEKVTKKPNFFVKVLSLFKKSIYGLSVASLFTALIGALLLTFADKMGTYSVLSSTTGSVLVIIAGVVIGVAVAQEVGMSNPKALGLGIATGVSYCYIADKCGSYGIAPLLLSYLISLVCAIVISQIFRKETKVDYVLIPLLDLLLGLALAVILSKFAVNVLLNVDTMINANINLAYVIENAIVVGLGLLITLISLIVKKAKK